MVIRYTIGDFGKDAWRALDLSLTLMRRLEPDAKFYVTRQGTNPFRSRVVWRGVTWFKQSPKLDVFGKYVPGRFDINDHEVFLDNDHIMWELPGAWYEFKSRRDAVLVWRGDVSYYGSHSGEIGRLRGAEWKAYAGMFGVPPGVDIHVPEKNGGDNCQEEMGGIVAQLAAIPEHVEVWDEVTCYHPTHNACPCDKVGTRGVHLLGLNRGWNPKGTELLRELCRRYGVAW